MKEEMWKNEKRKEAAVSFLIVVLGTFFLLQARGLETKQAMLWGPVLVTGALAARWARPYLAVFRGRQLLWPLGFSACLAAALAFGSQLEAAGNVDVTDVWLWVSIPVLTLYFAQFVAGAWGFLAQRPAGRRTGLKKRPSDPACNGSDGQKNPAYACDGHNRPSDPTFLGGAGKLLFAFLFFLVCWGIVLAAVYPGFFVYDAQDEYIQVATRTFTNHHPLLHVLLLGGAVCFGNKVFGSYNIGIFLYMLFQMFVMAGVFTYVLWFLKKHGCGRLGRRITMLYFGLFPVIPMYVLCSAKDTLYSASLLVMMMLLYELFTEGKGFFADWKRPLGLLLGCVLTVQFRHNGLYILAALLPFALLAAKKGCRRRTAGLLAGALVFTVLLSKLLVGALQASDAENQEMLTVPIQQLARTYAYAPETFNEEETAALYAYLPKEALKRYAPKVSDGVKASFDNQAYETDSAGFWRLWRKGLARKPAIYLNAWFMTSYGFWYPDAMIDVYRGNTVFTFTYEDSSYFGFETEQPGIRESKLPALEEFYRKLSLERYQQRIPLVSMLFSPGFLLWLFFFGFCFLGWKGQYRVMAALLPCFFNWGTVLFGPTYLVRYVLIFWFALPVAAIIVNRHRL